MASGIDLKVVLDDHGLRKIAELGKRLGEGDHGVKVGVFLDLKGGGDVDPDSGLTNVAKAAIHQFGAPEAGIPARDFLSAPFDRNRDAYAAIVRKLMPLVVLGKIPEKQMFDIVGMQAVTDINKHVRQGAGVPPPLKPATIARKGSSRPLIDTGRMLASVTWVTLTNRA
jgi:hypothetical protein